MANKKGDDSTIVLTDIKAALAAAENEAKKRPAAILAVGGELNGTIFDLLPGETRLGRGPDCDICLEFAGISRYHMKIVVDQDVSDNIYVFDLNSKNGTFLNNKKIENPLKLKKGDMIKLGSISLKYLAKGDPERLTYDKLQLEANSDGLTKCFNKTYFNRVCDLEVKKSKVTGVPLSLILFDLDHFKYLNDNFGHDAGDFVLKELSELVRNNGVRDQDIYARYGGEEFVILLPQTNLRQGFEIAERLRILIERHQFIYENKNLPVTASVGVADYRPGVDTGRELFKRSDVAVYKSKEEGRNRVNFFRG